MGGGLRGSSPANRHHPAGNNLRSAACRDCKVGKESDRIGRAQSTEKSLFTFHPYHRKAEWETHEPCRKGENRATIANESRATTSAAALLPFCLRPPKSFPTSPQVGREEGPVVHGFRARRERRHQKRATIWKKSFPLSSELLPPPAKVLLPWFQKLAIASWICPIRQYGAGRWARNV